jgi:hypothetical protein
VVMDWFKSRADLRSRWESGKHPASGQNIHRCK